MNESFADVNKYFDIDSNLTDKEQKALFEEMFQYNVFKWTCKPISCQDIMNQPTLKLVCHEYGYTEDVRVVMKGNCTDVGGRLEVTVVFQLVSKTTGDYYLGRSGRIVEETN